MRFAKRVREYLSSHSLDALVNAPFFRALTGATARALEEWSVRGSTNIVFATGRVQGFADELVILRVKYHVGSASSGDTVDVDLPRSLADGAGLHQGDYVWIFRRTFGTAALLDVLPAIPTTDSEDGGTGDAARGLAYLASGGDGLPTADEVQFLRTRRTKALPRRVVRPAG